MSKQHATKFEVKQLRNRVAELEGKLAELEDKIANLDLAGTQIYVAGAATLRSLVEKGVVELPVWAAHREEELQALQSATGAIEPPPEEISDIPEGATIFGDVVSA